MVYLLPQSLLLLGGLSALAFPMDSDARIVFAGAGATASLATTAVMFRRYWHW